MQKKLIFLDYLVVFGLLKIRTFLQFLMEIDCGWKNEAAHQDWF